jgi:hypothetical protein
MRAYYNATTVNELYLLWENHITVDCIFEKKS